MSAFMRLAQKLAQFPLTPLEAGIVQGYLIRARELEMVRSCDHAEVGRWDPADVAYLERLRVKYQIETRSF